MGVLSLVGPFPLPFSCLVGKIPSPKRCFCLTSAKTRNAIPDVTMSPASDFIMSGTLEFWIFGKTLWFDSKFTIFLFNNQCCPDVPDTVMSLLSDVVTLRTRGIDSLNWGGGGIAGCCRDTTEESGGGACLTQVLGGLAPLDLFGVGLSSQDPPEPDTPAGDSICFSRSKLKMCRSVCLKKKTALEGGLYGSISG